MATGESSQEGATSVRDSSSPEISTGETAIDSVSLWFHTGFQSRGTPWRQRNVAACSGVVPGMQILIPNLKDLPDVARAVVWRELIGCSALTMKRAGTLIPSGTKAQKLYTKKSILAWIGVSE